MYNSTVFVGGDTFQRYSHNSLLVGLPALVTLRPLQRVLSITAHIVSRSLKLTHVTPMLRSLHWLPVECHVQFKVLLILYGFIPYIEEMVQAQKPRPGLRSASEQFLRVPKTRISYGNRSFAAFAA
ncbi:hypothetical protein HOLleu_04729 [Holothuria leucospilota]|uniref:Uncharacterized protein n=1 Tax=Holothuria leucospilota TaxID=206669 RepID=A0A9Q1CJN9_HOLLE|nr:hypothetical protein HOLleu_04729 [Holothuria leucospilota]